MLSETDVCNFKFEFREGAALAIPYKHRHLL